MERTSWTNSKVWDRFYICAPWGGLSLFLCKRSCTSTILDMHIHFTIYKYIFIMHIYMFKRIRISKYCVGGKPYNCWYWYKDNFIIYANRSIQIKDVGGSLARNAQVNFSLPVSLSRSFSIYSSLTLYLPLSLCHTPILYISFSVTFYLSRCLLLSV